MLFVVLVVLRGVIPLFVVLVVLEGAVVFLD